MFADGTAGKDAIFPLLRHSAAAMHCTQERAGNGRVGVGVAACSDRVDEARLESVGMEQAIESVLKGDQDPALFLQKVGRRVVSGPNETVEHGRTYFFALRQTQGVLVTRRRGVRRGNLISRCLYMLWHWRWGKVPR